MTRILITGAEGFIGTHLVSELNSSEYSLICLTRESLAESDGSAISGQTDWSNYLTDVDVVIHLANAAHTNNISTEELEEVNVLATRNLVQQSIQSGVQQLVYISSSKVYGEKVTSRVSEKTPLNENDCDDYGRSKLRAENAIKDGCQSSQLKYTIIRPPLVYGIGAKANLVSLIRLCDSPMPLPFGKFKEPKSMVSVTNLVNLISHCIKNTAAENQVFNVSDQSTTSLYELLTDIRASMNRSQRIWPVPKFLVNFLMKILGKSEQFDKLDQPLVVSSELVQEQLNWKPTDDRGQVLKAMVYHQLK